MIISGRRAYDSGYIIDGDESLVQPASIDVRLDSTFLRFTGEGHRYGQIPHIDPAVELPEEAMGEHIVGNYSRHLLKAGEFVLASTFETVSLPNNVCGSFAGKSSLARLGLGVHVTAGFIDPGFTGQITIELANVNSVPIILYPGMKIGQIVFQEMTEPADVPYGEAGNSYQGQRGPTPYRGHRSFIKGLPNGA